MCPIEAIAKMKDMLQRFLLMGIRPFLKNCKMSKQSNEISQKKVGFVVDSFPGNLPSFFVTSVKIRAGTPRSIDQASHLVILSLGSEYVRWVLPTWTPSQHKKIEVKFPSAPSGSKAPVWSFKNQNANFKKNLPKTNFQKKKFCNKIFTSCATCRVLVNMRKPEHLQIQVSSSASRAVGV